MSRLYTIPLNGLKEGSYSYDFEVSGEFFDDYEGSEIRECDLRLRVEIEKLAGHYNVRFLLKGVVRVVCDRCLGEYMQPVNSENRLVVKGGGEFDDSDPELLILPASMLDLDISQFIYEYSHLSLPIRKVHPEGPDGKVMCDPEMIRRISNTGEGHRGPGPEWDKLKEFLHEN
ncbi:MAG: DUF177 domain-containing protein [Bacteroidales bacterium]|jgi:uncharacterized metal-binding protein YceD (DUF177 family)|nr:DUF177 domain-containing protein [Bacteroidales bacterium]